MAIERYNLNAVTLLREGLEHQLAKTIGDDVLASMLEEMRAKLEPEIRKAAGRVVLSGLENMKDLMQMREELYVYLRWQDEPATKSPDKVFDKRI